MFLCFACHETELVSYFSLNFTQIPKYNLITGKHHTYSVTFFRAKTEPMSYF